MPFKVKSVEVIHGSRVRGDLNVEHWQPGLNGTVLTQPLVLTIEKGSTTCEMILTDCAGKTPDESLNRMATWLRCMAEAIETRGESISLALLG